jgi:hypothetical protein
MRIGITHFYCFFIYCYAWIFLCFFRLRKECLKEQVVVHICYKRGITIMCLDEDCWSWFDFVDSIIEWTQLSATYLLLEMNKTITFPTFKFISIIELVMVNWLMVIFNISIIEVQKQLLFWMFFRFNNSHTFSKKFQFSTIPGRNI